MEDLVEQLKDKAGLTEEQAIKTIQTIKDYITSKLPPMFSGMVDNFLGTAAAEEDHLD
ncbi:MAG: hypothetical protein P4L41_03265 [Flavipsychrobacter sp.]|nr:hypothetical protein [Flavipsychrobacter sp.]